MVPPPRSPSPLAKNEICLRGVGLGGNAPADPGLDRHPLLSSLPPGLPDDEAFGRGPARARTRALVRAGILPTRAEPPSGRAKNPTRVQRALSVRLHTSAFS